MPLIQLVWLNAKLVKTLMLERRKTTGLLRKSLRLNGLRRQKCE
jgi:hypothetical protein